MSNKGECIVSKKLKSNTEHVKASAPVQGNTYDQNFLL